jgi:phosphatidylinositol-bisphosphatase
MLVLGFQELDLSTEALLYSMRTVREDAWCVSILAALGEKGVLYEKVWIRPVSILSLQGWLNMYLS